MRPKAASPGETNTDSSGRFQAINIQPGKYVIAVEKSGFKKAEVPITLDVNAKLDVGQIKLEIGNLTDACPSTRELFPSITTNTMEKAFLVDRTQIAELPMNGRNWVALMNTIPGMSSSARNDFDVNFNDVSQFHGLGGRGSQNNFYLDGSPNLDVGDNQSQYTQPSIDSIAEFRVLQSSFNAEYGRNEGMAVAVQTKSGAARSMARPTSICGTMRSTPSACCAIRSRRSCATTSSAAISAVGYRFRNSRPGRTRSCSSSTTAK